LKFFAAVALASLSLSASAFFDDFDGTQLGSNWTIQTNGNGWHYQVEDGLLSVDSLFGPNERNTLALVSSVPAFGDFTATARVAWQTEGAHNLRFGLTDAYNFGTDATIGHMGYEIDPELGPTMTGAIYDVGWTRTFPVSPGFHEFTLTRTGSVITAYADGNFLISSDIGSTVPLNELFFEFSGPSSESFAALSVDRVSVVPEPSSALLLLGGLAVAAFRRRKAKSL
jgi:hypothetical protein